MREEADAAEMIRFIYYFTAWLILVAIRDLLRVIKSFDTGSRTDWVLLMVMLWLVVLTVSNA